MSTTYGFNEFEKRLLRLASDTPDKIDKQVSRMQLMVLADTKLGTPVASGNLKRTWTIGPVNNGAGEVGTNADYAPPVENGFVHAGSGQKIEGHHMLEKAVGQMENRLPTEMKNFFDELAGDLKL